MGQRSEFHLYTVIHQYTDATTGSIFRMHVDDEGFSRDFFRERDERLLTIAWNPGKAQQLRVDGVSNPALGVLRHEPVCREAKARGPLRSVLRASGSFEDDPDEVWKMGL